MGLVKRREEERTTTVFTKSILERHDAQEESDISLKPHERNTITEELSAPEKRVDLTLWCKSDTALRGHHCCKNKATQESGAHLS